VFSGINPIFSFDFFVRPNSQKTEILPDSGSISPMIDFIVVVFPAPLGHKKP
jgi:hypothetical protein